MRNLIIGIIVGALGFFGYQAIRARMASREQARMQRALEAQPSNASQPSYRTSERATSSFDPAAEPLPTPQPAPEVEQSAAAARAAPEPASGPSYRCDGRKRCSQMSSCEEARWMLRNCTGMEMDGDGDGQPCERGPC